MTPEQLESLAGKEITFVFERMFSAVEKVRERLERSCRAFEQPGIHYAVIGAHAVAAWVATRDDGAVRNTKVRDVWGEHVIDKAVYAWTRLIAKGAGQ